ncbi:MAG: hypothetical protein JXB13_19670 [Phycisphaerae bacterium]|nr:hypothetical protein [Phycisphaerae bacterium]
MHEKTGCLVLGFVLVALGLNAPGRAEILQIRADITAEAEEYVGGVLTSSDSAFEQFPETQSVFPLEVGVVLGDPGGLTDVAFAFTDFRDPTRPTGSANPAEFGLETTCVSADPSKAYSVKSEAVETRTIRLTAADVGLSFGASRVSSELFLSGALILWAEESGRDLSGLEAEFRVTVYRVAGGSASDELFTTGLRLAGTANGRVTAAPLGSLVYEFGGADLLLSTSGSDGQTPEAVSEGIEPFGVFHVALIPNQAVTYEYDVLAGQTMDLEARFTTRVKSLPGGTGGGSAFGRQFTVLDTALQAGTGSAGAAAVQQAVNSAQESLEAAATSGRAIPGRGAACGAFGVEPAALGLAFVTLGCTRLVRRRGSC